MIGYKKLKIEKRWYRWYENEERLEEERERGEEKWKKKGIRGATEGMKMCFWNVAGLISKDKEVWKYLKTFDVIGLTETWIEEDNWEKLKYRLPKE